MFDEFIMKIDVKCFGYNNFIQDIKFMKRAVKIAGEKQLALLFS